MMTKAFASNGAKVYIVGRRKEKLDEAAKISPQSIIPIVGDVTSKDSLREVAKHVAEDCGFVNLLVCNSGVMIPALQVDPDKASVQEYAEAAMSQSMDEWNLGLTTNITGAMFTAFAFLELLDAGNKKGNAPGRQSQILMTSSAAAYLRGRGMNMPYHASKSAVSHLTKNLSSTLIPYSIRVNALAPGLFPSQMADSLIAMGNPTKDPTEDGSLPKAYIPAERAGKTDDMAGTVLYLASAAGAYNNGNIVLIGKCGPCWK